MASGWRLAERPGTDASGRPFIGIARNHRPDHVAILPDQIGACSIRDGCGTNNCGGDCGRRCNDCDERSFAADLIYLAGVANTDDDQDDLLPLPTMNYGSASVDFRDGHADDDFLSLPSLLPILNRKPANPLTGQNPDDDDVEEDGEEVDWLEENMRRLHGYREDDEQQCDPNEDEDCEFDE